MGKLYLFLPLILTDSSTESPVHVLMLSIQVVHGLPRLRAPGIVPCIISFSRQLLFTPALSRTDSFVFFAVIKPAESFSVLHLRGFKMCFFILSECPAVRLRLSQTATGHTSAFSAGFKGRQTGQLPRASTTKGPPKNSRR